MYALYDCEEKLVAVYETRASANRGIARRKRALWALFDKVHKANPEVTMIWEVKWI